MTSNEQVHYNAHLNIYESVLTSDILCILLLFSPISPWWRHTATTMFFHRVLPHEIPIFCSSAITVLSYLIFGRPGFLLLAGVHLRAPLGMLFLSILRTSTSHWNRRRLIPTTAVLQFFLLMEFQVGHFVWPEYPADFSQASIVKSIDLYHVPFNNSPAL